MIFLVLSLYISIWIILWSSNVAGKSSNEWMLWENQLEMVEGNAPTGENTTHRNQRPFCATSHFWVN